MPKTRELTVAIERSENGYYVGSIAKLPGCHSQAESVDDLMTRMKEAALLCREQTGSSIDVPLHFIGVQQIEVQNYRPSPARR